MNDRELLAEIKALNERWMTAFSNGDAIAVGSHYTQDALSLVPGRKPVVGKEAIIEYWSEAMKSGVGALNIKSNEVEKTGDIAVETGETNLLSSGGEVIDRFNYMVVWKKQDGEWLIHREIWNSVLK